VNEPTSDEVRAVPVAEMRAWYRDRVEQSSLRQVSIFCEVGHSTLHKFVAGTDPHPRVRRLLALAYLRAQGEFDPDAAALERLIEPLPLPQRDRARTRMLDVLSDAYRASQEPAPKWLKRMRGV
jgi:hypothetical protein